MDRLYDHGSPAQNQSRLCREGDTEAETVEHAVLEYKVLYR